MSEEGRRFTDSEVALVLKRATELDDVESNAGHRGTSLEDLRSHQPDGQWNRCGRQDQRDHDGWQ